MKLVYPAPAIVVGVGRFGLAALESLGDDWMGLRLSGADVSLGNLRLLSVLPERDGEGWRRHERDAVQIAHYLGDSDLPSLALDFAILRSLGLVRSRDGSYQVALPRDAGVVEIEVPAHDGNGRPERSLRRRRYFEWIKLSPDPIVATERLRQLTERLKEVDLFVTPLLNRVKQGHSPSALLACIDRCRALFEGRDPGPWNWLEPEGPQESEEAVEGAEQIEEEHRLSLGDLGALKVLDLGAVKQLERHLEGAIGVPEPLPGWREWIADNGEEPEGLVVPSAFVRRPSDLPAPLDPSDLLDRDWEATGWASERRRKDVEIFHPLRLGPFRLGLFDHDGRDDRLPDADEFLRQRLEELGEQLHRGLVRLWVDLQRERVTELNVHVLEQARQRDELSDALQQSIEVLGELLVRPLTVASRSGAGSEEVPARDGSAAENELPAEPSRFLSRIEVEQAETDDAPARLLDRRLAGLGFREAEEEQARRRPLLEDVRLHGPVEALEPEAVERQDLRRLRQALNRQVRQLFDFSFLTRYRDRPTRRPPRLTVFVVGDMSETFTREVMRLVLREVHSELLRSFTPIFESYREGFDRCLCVTPILWMPHPADPFQGGKLDVNRCEEAAIIDTIHGIRRWVECVLPPGRRCISQIFVNSRVTDTAALSITDALRQTRDFLSFQMRNDLSGDVFLRQTSVGSGGADLFSSFSCYEIDFPALRCREYLATRLARECLAELKAGPEVRLEPPKPFEPPPLDRLVTPAREALGSTTRQAADALGSKVQERAPLTEATAFRQIQKGFDRELETSLLREVNERWSELTGRLGKVDEMVDELRLVTSRLVGKEVDRVRSHSDGLIEEYAADGGLKAAQAGFQMLKSVTRDTFQEQERLRRGKEALCQRHAIPELGGVHRTRLGVLAAAERKPDLEPLRVGLLIWALLAAVLGAPLSQAVSYMLDLHLRPNWLELALGPGGLLAGGLALWLPVWALLRWHMRRRLAALQAAVDRMAEEVRAIIWGAGAPPEKEGRASIRSFLESRLELTGAVATRGFALAVLERAVADSRLAHRLVRSVDVQAETLARKSEDLGIRAAMTDGGVRGEELDGLFESRASGLVERLIDPASLHAYYKRRVGEDLSRRLPDFIKASGGFDAWRGQACLADTGRILDHTRKPFDPLVEEPISDQHSFGGEVGLRLVRFLSRFFPNLGFGAGFKGYEGLDPDNVQILADAALVLHRGMEGLVRNARHEHRGQFPTTETLQVITAGVRPNAAYMLSLVQGVRVHSLRNLRRFESFHNRIAMPDDRTFPLSNEPREAGSPINPLTGYEEIGRGITSVALSREGSQP